MAVTLYQKTIGVTPNLPQLAGEINADGTITPKTVAAEGISFTEPNVLDIYMSDALTGPEETALDAVIAAHTPATELADTNAATYVETGAPTVDDDEDGGVLVNDRWINTTTNLTYICVDNTSGAAVWLQETYRHNLTATTDPTVNADIGGGYTKGSLWLNTTTDQAFICADATSGSAVWPTLVATSDDLPTVQVRHSASVAITTAWADIAFDTTDLENDTDVLEHDDTNTDRILVKETGLYMVAYMCSVDADAGEEVFDFRVRVNDTAVIDGSERQISEDDEINAVGNTVVVELTAGDYITYQVMGSGTGNPIIPESTYNVTRMRGPKGDRGATGSGSSITVENSGTSIPNTPHSALNFAAGITASDGGSGVADIELAQTAAYVDYYNSASYQGITTTASTLPLNTTRQSASEFTLASNEVTCNTAGDYRIDYDLSLDEGGSNDTGIDMWLELNTVEVGGTRARMFHDSSNEEGGNHGMAILTLAENDVLRIRAQVISGSGQTDTLADGTRLMIHSIGSNGAPGATGPQGPSGSGSTVIIEDEGTSIPNTPHSNLNFVGAGVTASDGGSGVATITIPGGVDPNIAQYRRAASQTINTTATTITLDADDFEDSYYSRSGADITVSQAGIYEVSYSLYFDTRTSSRRTVETWIENNTAEIVPSRSADYSRNATDDTGSMSASFFVQLAANDVLRMRAQSTGTAGSATGIGNRIWIKIAFVRSV